MPSNLYALPDPLPDDEVSDDLIPDRGVRIERIVTAGKTTPPGAWYDQPRDEWVALLQGTARLEFADGRAVDLSAGDHVLLPARVRHRVAAASADPPCIWLAVHGDLSGSGAPAG